MFTTWNRRLRYRLCLIAPYVSLMPVSRPQWGWTWVCCTFNSSSDLTYSMEQSRSWEANRFSASQEILDILWNPKAQYLIHKWSTPVPILSHSVPSIPLHPTSWILILILSSHLRLGLPSGLFPSGFPTKTLYTPLFSPIRATCSAHLILLDFYTRTILARSRDQ